MSSPRLRVVVVNPVGDLGGAESYLLQMIDASDRLEIEAVLLADGPLKGELESRGIAVTLIPVGARPQDLAAGTRALGRLLSRTDCDVVVANGVKAQAVVGPAAWYLGVASVWIKHDHSYDRTLTRPLSKLATRVVATAEAVADAVVDRDDVVLIPPPRAPEPVKRDEARTRLGAQGMVWEPDVRYLAMSTRLTPYKGVDVAIEALASAPDWHLVVMGAPDLATPDELNRLTAIARRFGVLARVHLLGYVPGASSLLTAFDAVAVLTRRAGRRTPGREGFGMSAMEAMVAGLPVIAPDDGGSIARRTKDDAGVLVDAASADSVAAGLRRLRDDESREVMSRVALTRSQEHPGIDQLAPRLLRVLTEVARRPGAGLRGRRPVSVVTPVLDEVANLDRLLGPILRQLRENDELVVVDSGSTDGTRQMVSEYAERDSRVVPLQVGACSIGASRNHGVRAARHDLVVCTDAGCRPDDDWLERMRSGLEEVYPEAPEVLIGTYRVAVRRRCTFEAAMSAVAWPDPEELRRSPWPVRVWLATIGPRFDDRRVDGRSLGFTTAVHEQAGGFPEDLLTAEDEAFGRAVLASGGRMALIGDATVTWWQRESIPAAFRQFRGYGRGGGNSGSPFLLAKDLTRVCGYVAVVSATASSRPWLRLAGAGALVALLGFPAHRVVRRGHPRTALLMLPMAQAVKDVGKLVGVFEGVVLGRRGRLPHHAAADGPTSPDGRG